MSYLNVVKSVNSLSVMYFNTNVNYMSIFFSIG